MAKSFSVTKHNDLITSAYRLTLTEMQVILYGISLINPLDGKFPRSYEINIKNFSDMFHRNKKNTYRDVKDAIMRRFWDREFTFHDKYETNRQGELVRARVKWVTTVKYSDKAGFLKIYFNPEIEEYLHNLKGNFTTYYIKQVSKFKRFYSVRFYEIAVMHLNKSKSNDARFILSLDELRIILEIEEKYSMFSNLKMYVLDPAIKEVNTCSDLKMSYQPIKKGRKYYEIILSVSRPKPNDEESKLNAADEATKYHKRVAPRTIETAKNIVALAHTGWDIYSIEAQYYDFIKSKGQPDNIDSAFIGFVKRKVIQPPK